MTPQEIQAMRDRIEELEDLIGVSIKDPNFHRWGLSPKKTAVLGVLYRGKITSRESIFGAMYGGRSECDQPDDFRIVDVYLSKVRVFLKPLDISIQNNWGVGWWITDESKAKLRHLMESSAHERAAA